MVEKDVVTIGFIALFILGYVLGYKHGHFVGSVRTLQAHCKHVWQHTKTGAMRWCEKCNMTEIDWDKYSERD